MITAFDFEDYHLRFNTKTGFMVRWGKNLDDDPVMSPTGPEIADIEISTICNGIGNSKKARKPCQWCYKSNTGKGENMSLQTFQEVLGRFPPPITQVALGIGDIDSNPDLLDILDYCRNVNVIPNLTTNGMGLTDQMAHCLSIRCGAVAVSHYGIDDVCFEAVELLSKRLEQTNIHKMVAEETLTSCYSLIDSVTTDVRLKGLKALVFLLMKPKGDRNGLTPIKDLTTFSALLSYAIRKGVSVGMDSCSAPMALKTLPASVIPVIEPCESTLFSIYVNVKGELFPCSFTEGTPGWAKGIDLLATDPKFFTTNIWKGARLSEWRKKLLTSSSQCQYCKVQKHCRSCPIYDITPCRE